MDKCDHCGKKIKIEYEQDFFPEMKFCSEECCERFEEDVYNSVQEEIKWG